MADPAAHDSATSDSNTAGAPTAVNPKDARKQARLEAERARQQGKTDAASQLAHRFGVLPLVRSTTYNTQRITPIAELHEGSATVILRARLHAARRKGKVCFALLRQDCQTVQCVASVDDSTPTELVAFMASVSLDSVVEVYGTVMKPAEPVTAATKCTIEILVMNFHVLSAAATLPFGIEDASRPDHVEGVHVAFDTRLNHRFLDLRSRAANCTFRLQSRVGWLFRAFLDAKNYVEIHSPKICAASEGGANLFTLKYFDRSAILAQSPQLYKQMCVMGDLPRVFEVGPVFRAENSNTHRHLTEFVGLDIEMVIQEHYYEVLNVAEALFGYIFKELEKETELLDGVQSQYPFSPLIWQVPVGDIALLGLGVIEENIPSTDKYEGRIQNSSTRMLRIPYRNCVALLNTILEVPLAPTDDINAANEKLLGGLVRHRYGVDWFISDRFPSQCRPFFTMPCLDDPQFTNSYDMFIRGEEIASGAQRIHDADMLLKRGAELNVNMGPLKDYVDSFRYGAWPHGGFGVGLERVVMLYLALPNIRFVSMYPRDPHRLTP